MASQTETQLAGSLPQNPNLVDQVATTIINEVISPNPSVLSGNLTVVGHPANVIVANPFGITCDGCGFIHTPNATLTTGRPMFDEREQLAALEVKQGAITINGQGIDASNNDSLAFISRTIKVNSKIDAKDLYVIIGNNRVNTNRFIVSVADNNNLPRRAIDSTALGGMHANYIKIVSTEKGVGINLANLHAAGNIEMDVKGKITLYTIKSQRTVNVAGDNLLLTGKFFALKNMVFTSRGDCFIDKAVLRIADDTMEITAANRLVTHDSRFTAGKSTLKQASEEGEIAFSGKNLIIHSTNASAAMIDIQSKNTITQNDTSQLFARELNFNCKKLDLKGHLVATENLALHADSLQSSKTTIIGSENRLNITLTNDSLLAGEIMASKNLSINAHVLINKCALRSTGNLHIATDHLRSYGPLESDNLYLTGNQWDNYGKIKTINTISTDKRKRKGRAVLTVIQR